MGIIKFQGEATPEWILNLFNIRNVEAVIIDEKIAEDEYEDLFIAYGNYEINTDNNEILDIETGEKFILAETDPFEQVASIDHSEWIDNEIEYFDSDIYDNEEFETARQSDDLEVKKEFIRKILKEHNAGTLA